MPLASKPVDLPSFQEVQAIDAELAEQEAGRLNQMSLQNFNSQCEEAAQRAKLVHADKVEMRVSREEQLRTEQLICCKGSRKVVVL